MPILRIYTQFNMRIPYLSRPIAPSQARTVGVLCAGKRMCKGESSVLGGRLPLDCVVKEKRD